MLRYVPKENEPSYAFAGLVMYGREVTGHPEGFAVFLVVENLYLGRFLSRQAFMHSLESLLVKGRRSST